MSKYNPLRKIHSYFSYILRTPQLPSIKNNINIFCWKIFHNNLFAELLDRGFFNNSNLLLGPWCVFGGLLGFSCFLGAHTGCSGSNTSRVQCIESAEFLLVFGDCAEFKNWLSLCERHNWTNQLCGQFAFFFCGFSLAQFTCSVSLTWFTVFVNWEQDQFISVFLQALNILLT